MAQKTRVIVVDDSSLMRRMLSDILSSDEEVEVVGTAEDPYVAREKIKQLNPDVITLDVEMPRMHGLDFLEKIMTLRPMPVVMISSLTTKGGEVTMRALELGAVDFIAKPADIQNDLPRKREEIIAKVKTAAQARPRALHERREVVRPVAPAFHRTDLVIAVGASTGGVEALGQLLQAMPLSSPPILITQHMPERFIPVFASRLNNSCEIEVGVARDEEALKPGHAYIAPGEIHLELAGEPGAHTCRLHGHERVNGHCPSVDVLFDSVAKSAGKNAVGVILTGMGRDGADGLLAMRRAGAHTIGQDPASSLVYGMPRVAFERGGVEIQLPLSAIPKGILSFCSGKTARAVS